MLQKKDIIKLLTTSSVKKELQSFQIKHLRLAGSFNTGQAHPKSDIDLIYEKDSSVSFDNRGPLGAYIYLQEKLHKNIDIMKKENIRKNIVDSVLSSATQLW